MLPDFFEIQIKQKQNKEKTSKQNKASKGEIISQKSKGFDHSAPIL